MFAQHADVMVKSTVINHDKHVQLCPECSSADLQQRTHQDRADFQKGMEICDFVLVESDSILQGYVARTLPITGQTRSVQKTSWNSIPSQYM
jgi:hypothetical protein